ncbi:MAG: DUF4347 domain-containing protein, partial [Symploca sp. SIO1A3]|nr:DUF4347 domain-containing protein [Symploca sp. SIO1A3]
WGNIAASAKRTGSVALGGDWKLEVTTNQIQVSLAFEAMVQEAYTGVLATFLVNNTGDFDDGDIGNGVTTLREAINAANATSTDDIIEFASGLSGQTITLTNGQLEITDDLFIDGLGADQLTISGNNASRIFNIDDGDAFNSFDVKISGLSIADGNADFGGGIFNEEQLLISSSTIRDNTAQFSGGGIFSDGRLNIENSTISGNTAEIGPGGAISGSDFLAMTNVTISGNQAGNNGGGISFGQSSDGDTLMVDSSTITQNTTNGNGGGIFSNLGNPNDDLIAINNSIIAQNFDNDSSDGNSPDVWGQFSSNNRFNLIGDLGDNTSNGDFLTAEGNQVGTSTNPIAPKLGSLQNNGGSTFTHALLEDSPAIDAGIFAGIGGDQRGVLRPQGSGFDIGAFEALPFQITVTTLEDEDDGNLNPNDISLREAILFGSPGATINFDPSLTGGTIELTLGELLINKDLTIDGLGADKLTISGNNTSRVFKVDDGNPNNLINLEISGLTIAEGSTDEGGGIFSTETLSITNSTIRNNQAGDTGGGLYNDGGILNIYNSIIRDNIGHTDTGGIENRGTMMIDNSTISNNQGGSFAGGIRNLSGTATITNSTISGNKANSGGGISNGGYGALLIANSTISGNSALDSGGGIYASSGSLRVFNSTITLNTADSDGDNLDNDDGGGINALSSSTVEVKNTIIAGNFDKSNSGNINPDVAGDFINSSFNFIGDATGSNSFTNNVDGNQVGTSAHPIDPMLGDLQDNGGPTFTHAPLPGSPVLDAANPLAGVTVDQRGISRPQGEGFDIGAVEGSLNPSSVGTRDSDRIVGDSGNNVINGGRGADVIFGGAGNDILRGAGGDDILKGEDGNDRLMGHGGNNSLFGGNDNDTLWGGQRDDLLDGGAGSDRLFGQNGNDTLLGGHDLDLLEGGRGNDLMTGGEGNDIFQLRQSDFMGGTFVDQILDFNAAEDDRLRLVDISMDEVMFNKIGTSDLELTFTFGGKVTFVGVTDAIFVASNVDFDATRLGNNSPLPVS